MQLQIMVFDAIAQIWPTWIVIKQISNKFGHMYIYKFDNGI